MDIRKLFKVKKSGVSSLGKFGTDNFRRAEVKLNVPEAKEKIEKADETDDII